MWKPSKVDPIGIILKPNNYGSVFKEKTVQNSIGPRYTVDIPKTTLLPIVPIA